MSERTDLPWDDGGAETDFFVAICNAQGETVAAVAGREQRRRILTAVNNHDALVEALEYAVQNYFPQDKSAFCDCDVICLNCREAKETRALVAKLGEGY